MTELDARGVPAVFPADPDFEVLPDLPAFLDAHPHEMADSFAVQRLERIEGEYAAFHMIEKEFPFGIVPTVSERRLGQVVRPEREELRVLRNLVGGDGGPRNLDHRPELVSNSHAFPLRDFLCLSLQGLPLNFQFVHVTRKRDHDLWPNDDALFRERARCLQDRSDLHLRDL